MKRLTIEILLQNNVKIFDFDYPYYKEELKPVFEQKFIDNFMFDEIGLETVALFKHRLKVKLQLIMPTYNKIYETLELDQRIMDNYDVTETYIRNTIGVTSGSNSNEMKNLYKDTPKTKIDIDKFDTVTNLTKNINQGKSDVTSSGDETWTRKMQGNIGVATDSDAIQSYWKSLRRLEEEIFNELECLFMEVYD